MNSSKTRRQELIEELVEKVCRKLEEDFKNKKNPEKEKTSSSRPKPSSTGSSTQKKEKDKYGAYGRPKKGPGSGRRVVAPGDLWGV